MTWHSDEQRLLVAFLYSLASAACWIVVSRIESKPLLLLPPLLALPAYQTSEKRATVFCPMKNFDSFYFPRFFVHFQLLDKL